MIGSSSTWDADAENNENSGVSWFILSMTLPHVCLIEASIYYEFMWRKFQTMQLAAHLMNGVC